MELYDYIWNHHEKCIQINTNMPSIGLVIHEIHFEEEKRGDNFAASSGYF